jgi:tetratricopeptide (TPR) repeat protein
VVVDLQSTNGVQVNDKTQPEAVLKNFDIIQIGNLKLRFEVEGDLESGAAAASDSDAALDGSEPPNSNQETMMIPTNNRKLKRSGSKRMRWLALATIVLAGSFWAFQNTARIQEFLQSSLKGFVQGQLSALPAQIAQDLGKPISEAAPEDVKSLVLQKMQSFPLPEDMKQYLQQVPAELYHSILSDPELTQALIDNNGNIAEVFALMRSRMIEAFKAQRNEEASKYVDLFLKEAPENAELLTMRKELDERMSFVGLEKGQLVTPEERETFVKIMMQHNKTYEEYVSAQDFDGAKDYATKLLERLDNLVKQKPQFAEYVTSAGTEWRGKQRQMNQSIEERSKRRALIAKQEEKGADLIAEINQLFLAKRYSDSLRKTNDFIRAYPDHGDIASMEGLRDDLIREIKVTLDRTRQDITSLVQIENFKQAWDLLYQIGDQVGVDHQSFLEIRAELESKTSAKGAQLYNQARVFEFEADDIVAAEQFYKKTLDTVDPRGELADKANRRFQAVRRKNLQ